MTTNGSAPPPDYNRVISTKKSDLTRKAPVLSTGLAMWYGITFEEYLTQLKPWQRLAKIYREMTDDAVIGSMLEAIYTPLLSTPFNVIPVDDSDEQKKAKEFIEENLFNIPNQEWLEHTEDAMEFLSYGFAITEKVYEKRADGLFHLRALIPIGQETLLRWGERDEYGDVTGFIQLVPTTGRQNAAPMNKLLHFTWRTRKKSPMGRSLLRSLYRPWYFKRNLEALEAIGIERGVGNVPMATLQAEFYGGGDESDRLTALKDALDNFRIDETAYIILPRGVTVEPYGGGGKAYDIRAVIRDWGHVIKQRFFADFLSMGSEKVGTQSLAKELNTFFKLALVSVQRRMLEVWNRQLIPQMFEINNIPMAKYPKLAWNDPSSINIQALAQAYSMLVKANLLQITPELIKHLHEQLRLPVNESKLGELVAGLDKARERGDNKIGDNQNAATKLKA